MLLGTSVLTPTFRYNPAVVAQAFATMGCLFPGRVIPRRRHRRGDQRGRGGPAGVAGVQGTLRPAARGGAADPRALDARSASPSTASSTRPSSATVYDRPDGGVPIYIAAGGPLVARYAGRAGDGFICTSGKGMDLYTDKLMPAVDEGLAGRPGTVGLSTG